MGSSRGILITPLDTHPLLPLRLLAHTKHNQCGRGASKHPLLSLGVSLHQLAMRRLYPLRGSCFGAPARGVVCVSSTKGIRVQQSHCRADSNTLCRDTYAPSHLAYKTYKPRCRTPPLIMLRPTLLGRRSARHPHHHLILWGCRPAHGASHGIHHVRGKKVYAVGLPAAARTAYTFSENCEPRVRCSLVRKSYFRAEKSWILNSVAV